jgi:hypothetical protein
MTNPYNISAMSIPASTDIPARTDDSGLASCIDVGGAALGRFRRLWTAWMVVATSLPYIWNFLAAPPGYRYTWILPPYRDDSYGYMAWSQQAAHGALLFKVKFTAIPHSAFLFQPFFLICGWLSHLFAGNIGLVHLLAKEAGVVLFFAIFYRYIDYLRLTAFQSIVASVLVGVSSGIGGILAVLYQVHEPPAISADLWMPEVSTYWSLLWNPLFPFSLALMLLAIYWIDRGTREQRTRDLWRAGLAAGVLALIHPYSQPLLFVFAVFVIAVRVGIRGYGYLLRYGAALAPFAAYVALVSIFQPIIAQHSAQGAMNSPTLWWYVTGFGLPLLIWAAGWALGAGRWMKQYWQLAAWFGLSFALAYAPFWFQRKLIFGAHIPLCILAAISFDRLLARSPSVRVAKVTAIAAALVIVPVLVFTPLYLAGALQREVRANIDGLYYVSPDMDAALKFLKQHSRTDDVVLATAGTSLLIPAFSGNTVLWGHWAMSVDRDERLAWSNDLFERPQRWDDPARAKDFWGSGI